LVIVVSSIRRGRALRNPDQLRALPDGQQPRRKHGGAVLAALALLNPQDHPAAIDVAYL